MSKLNCGETYHIISWLAPDLALKPNSWIWIQKEPGEASVYLLKLISDSVTLNMLHCEIIQLINITIRMFKDLLAVLGESPVGCDPEQNNQLSFDWLYFLMS